MSTGDPPWMPHGRDRRIAVVSPSFRPRQSEIDAALLVLEKVGFDARVETQTLHARPNWHGPFRPVEPRVAELVSALRNPEIDAVWCADGGAGASYLLPHLARAYEERPWPTTKPVVGFSDVNFVQLYLTKLGHPCYLAPNAILDADNDAETLETAARWFHERWYFKEGGPLELSFPADIYREGEARGVFIGGNFSVLSAISQAPKYAPDFKGSLLFFEEHGPSLPGQHEYSLWEKLQALQLSQAWAGALAILVGEVEVEGPYATDEDLFPSLYEVIERTLPTMTEGPVVVGFPFGTSSKSQPIPLGVPARLEAKDGHCKVTWE
jgi:muramoyltetrapeptide carboxypeptidase